MKRKLILFVKQFDADYLNGMISNMYYIVRKWREKDFFHRKSSIVLNEPVADMLLMQYDGGRRGEIIQYAFYDVAVRFLFIEEYYGYNKLGYDLYKKMHMKRGNYGQINESENYYEKQRKNKKSSFHGQVIEEHSIEQFEALVQSYEKLGYQKNSIIMADQGLLNMNGSHRIALALYHDQEFIMTEVHKLTFHRAYNINWFWENGFDKDEIFTINETMSRLLKKAKKSIGYYYCILFPPAYEYFDRITTDINEFDKENISVADSVDYNLEVNDFIGLLRGVYHFDSILPRNFERKLYYILRASDILDGKVKFRVLSLDIKNPLYRLKKDNGMPEAMATVRLKEMVRNRYKPYEKKFSEHFIKDYAHDVIIHSSDNYISNKAFEKFLSLKKDVCSILSMLSGYCYAFAAVTPDKVSRDFPHNFYLGEDFDVIIMERDADEIVEKTYELCNAIFCSYGLMVKKENSKYGIRVRILYRDFTVTMFDYMFSLVGIKSDFQGKFLLDRVFNGTYYVLSELSEAVYRIWKYIGNPSKTYHLEYLKENKERYDINTVISSFDADLARRAQKIFAKISEGKEEVK